MVKIELNLIRRHLYALIAIVAAFALIVPTAGWAADYFKDVPDTNVFHDDIAWLADAGVTKGCNPPANDEFCPGDNVRRETMAAFMHRLAVNQVVDAKTAITAESAAYATTAGDADLLEGFTAAQLLSELQGSRLDVPAAAFTPETDEVADYRNNPWGSLRIDPASAQGEVTFVAPVVLPHGASVTSITALSTGELPTSWYDVVLTGMSKTVLHGNSFVVVGGVDGPVGITSGAVTSASTSISKPLIDADGYWYNLMVNIKPGTGIIGVEIHYTLP